MNFVCQKSISKFNNYHRLDRYYSQCCTCGLRSSRTAPGGCWFWRTFPYPYHICWNLVDSLWAIIYRYKHSYSPVKISTNFDRLRLNLSSNTSEQLWIGNGSWVLTLPQVWMYWGGRLEPLGRRSTTQKSQYLASPMCLSLSPWRQSIFWPLQ